MDAELKKISDAIGFTKAHLIRYLLSRSIKQLKSDGVEAGGYSNLEFTLRHI